METESRPLDEPPADDAFFAQRRCWCCLWIPWSSSRLFESSSSVQWWERIGREDRPSEEGQWRRRGVLTLMKLREWSELVAGPRWKTFIRRFNRNPRFGGGGGRVGSTLQYDPLSYALNFDEGHGGSPEGDYSGYRDFSTRFAAPPALAKALTVGGGRESQPISEIAATFTSATTTGVR